jgi:hypothetical protein
MDGKIVIQQVIIITLMHLLKWLMVGCGARGKQTLLSTKEYNKKKASQITGTIANIYSKMVFKL